MNLRDEIDMAVHEVNWERPGDTTDRILAAVREALLSDEAIEIMAKAEQETYTGSPSGWAHREDGVERGITAALYAVMGDTDGA